MDDNRTESADARETPAVRAQAGRPRVLVSAFIISPVRGSEAAMGWQLLTRLATRFDVHALTCPRIVGENYQQETERWIAERGPVPGLTFHYVQPTWLSWLVQREERSLWRAIYYQGYASWQRAAFAAAKDLHRRFRFDLVHQLGFTGYREPGFLWQLDAPFVWGPVAGASDMPWSYFPLLGWYDRVAYSARNLLNGVQQRLAIRPRQAARRARHIWVTSLDNQEMVRHRWRREAVIMHDSGTTHYPQTAERDFDGRRPIRLAWSGLHIGRKMLPLLLRSLTHLDGRVPYELVVLGGGPETGSWKRQAESLGVAAHVRWTGSLPHARAVEEMARADVFVFTSLKEGMPHVVQEALSLGVPVLTHRACGMATAVTDDCGIRIGVRDIAHSERKFAEAIESLWRNPDELRRLSRGAIRRAEDLSWDANAQRIAEAYQRVMAGAEATSGPDAALSPAHFQPSLGL